MILLVSSVQLDWEDHIFHYEIRRSYVLFDCIFFPYISFNSSYCFEYNIQIQFHELLLRKCCQRYLIEINHHYNF